MSDPIETKKELDKTLDQDIGRKKEQYNELRKKVNDARDEAKRVIEEMDRAVDKAYKSFMEFYKVENSVRKSS